MNWRFRHFCTVMLMASLLGLCGCGRELESRYGFRRPAGSVNGTEVLAQLFKEAGHNVTGWSRFSPRLETKADCIVWFAQSLDGPSEEAREWVENWLEQSAGRTFIYVGRDYDGELDYWTQIRDETTGDEFRELSRQLADVSEQFARGRYGQLDTEDAGWFTINRTKPLTVAKTFAGDAEWLREVDHDSLRITLQTRFEPADSAEVLLRAGDDVLVARQQVGESELYVVTNGSFMLNLPLVNHECRKLAAVLINQIGDPPRNVVFLESRSDEPSIYEEEPQEGKASLFRYFSLEPLNLILLHLAFIGAVFLFARAPIFGVARHTSDERIADFGQHVEAYGTLLARTGDSAFALQRIKHYESVAHHDGPRHHEQATPSSEVPE